VLYKRIAVKLDTFEELDKVRHEGQSNDGVIKELLKEKLVA